MSQRTRQHIQQMRLELDLLEVAIDSDTELNPSWVEEPGIPPIFSREDIGLRDVKGTYAALDVGTIVHISGGKPPTEAMPAFQILRTMQHYHIDVRGWDDVGYNWGVCNKGFVYELRGALVRGAHAGPKYNGTHMSIVWLGGHKAHASVKPTQAAFGAIAWLLRGAAGPEVLGHREVSSKGCPGDEIFAWLKRYREQREKETGR